jgi:predicted dehydrogenase
MNPQDKNPQRFSFLTSRRQFLKTSATAVAGAALARPGYAESSDTIKIALVGCGGRGTGAAAQAMNTKGTKMLCAMADVFEDRLEGSLKSLAKKYDASLDVPQDRRFLGFDAYKKAIDAVGKGGIVLLATPPAFRPLHVEYAVSKGVHVFMEKSMAVDVPGVKRLLRAGEMAKKNSVKIAGGLMSRHSKALEACIEQIHKGAIGEVVTAWAYREHGPVGYKPRQPGWSELEHQIRNYSCFTWVNGTFLEDWLIHNIDVCCWAKNAWPVSCQGQGGRQTRTEKDQLFDHYAAEYTFADGSRLFAQGRHIAACWNFFGNVIHGTKGCGHLGEGVSHPRLFKGWNQTDDKVIWEKQGQPADAYQNEHDLLFDAIRNDKPYNETERCANTCLTTIMGRMACESGQLIKWDEMMANTSELAPGLENFTKDSPAPVQPDAQGNYPVAVPGKTKPA